MTSQYDNECEEIHPEKGGHASNASDELSASDAFPDSEPRYRHGRTSTGRMPRQWLFDRCDGKSKIDPERRPPSRVCYAPPFIKLMPDILEQNCFCESFGRIGFRLFKAKNEKARRRLLTICFCTNVVGLLFLILSTLAISQDVFGLVWNFSFTSVWMEILSSPTVALDTPTFFGVGLKAAAYKALIENEEVLVPFSQFCSISEPDPASQQGIVSRQEAQVRVYVDTLSASTPEGDCSSCERMSSRIVPSLFLAMLGYIPNFTGNILRMYSNYDVNCAKCNASVMSWITLGSAIYTWVNYHLNCFSYIDHEPIALDSNWAKVTDPTIEPYLVVVFHYRPGTGEILLALATLLKVVDIICNCMMPTPSITRNHELQVEYEWKYGQPQEEQEQNCKDEELAER